MAELKPVTSDAVMQTLAWTRKQGFKAVPLHYQSKAAINKRYTEPNYQPPSDEFWRKGQFGIGVAVGPKMNGPVDIDLDCEEAVFFARKFLPPTQAVFGRPSKRASHYLYRVENEVSKVALMDPVLKETIVELRADGGHQTVLPGSVHQDTGEIIEWDDLPFPEVPHATVDDLSVALRKVGIASLIARHLWHDGQRNEVCKHLSGLFFYLEWDLQETIKLIEAVMEYTGDDDRTRRPTIELTYKKGENNAKVSGAGVLRKFCGEDKLVDRLLEWAGSPTVNLITEYNEKYAVVSVAGKFRIADLDFDPGETPLFYQRDDFIGLTEHDRIAIDDKLVPKARVWLASPRRRMYTGVDFVPGAEDIAPKLNLWTGWAVQPSPEGSCEAWLELLHRIICGGNDTLYTWMLNWFANIVREPTRKAMTAPVVIGTQGAGKSILFEYFGRILGGAFVVLSNEEQLYGRFNKHISTALLVQSEEALWGGEKKHRGIIKSLITDNWRIFEQKGLDAYKVKNYLRMALTSNYDHAAPVERDDRRFTVLSLEGRSIKHDKLKHHLIAERDGSGPAALFHYLLNMKYDGDLVRVNVNNRYLAEMKSVNYSPIEQWWFTTLMDGTLLPDYLAWASAPSDVEWPSMVGSTALYAAYLISCRARGNNRGISQEMLFAIELNKMLGRRLARVRRRFVNPVVENAPELARSIPSRQNAIVDFPSLAECRKAFEEYIGHTIEWPNDSQNDELPAHMKY